MTDCLELVDKASGTMSTTMSLDNVLSLVIHEDVYQRWRHLGSVQGLNRDADIASFLLQYFENSAPKSGEGFCISCQRALPTLCKACEAVAQQGQLQQQVYPVPSTQLATAGNLPAAPHLQSLSHDAHSQLPVVPPPPEIVIIDASKAGSAPALVENGQDKLLFTDIQVVGEGELDAGRVSVVDLNLEQMKPETTGVVQDQVQTPSSHPPVESSQGEVLSTEFVEKGEPFSAKVFHISDPDKLAVGAVFTTCVRKIKRICRPPVQPSETPLSEEKVEKSAPNKKEKTRVSVSVEEPAQDEGGEEEDGTADAGFSGEEEEEETAEEQELPPLFVQRRKPYSTRKTWGRPPYLCQTCGMSFNNTSTLSRHILKHTGERPYPCSQCDAAFVSRPELRNHFRKHTGEKPYLCPICGSAFDRSTNLNTHMRTHTGERPYRCDHCGACFTTSSSLNRHRRIHTGEKPYVCSQCDAAFPQLAHLKEHVLKHTGARPFQCQTCSATFCTRARLLRHQRKVRCGAPSNILS